MRVNSDFKRPFNKLFTIGPGITIVMLTIFLTTSAFTTNSDREQLARQVNLIIRQIGHRLLLQAGDSTSRVMPVTEIKEGRFQLSFENEFIFNHDSLIALSQTLLPKSNFPAGYTLTVHEGIQADIVYGFKISNTTSDVISCQGRSEPQGRYVIEIDFPALYKKLEVKKEAARTKTQPERVIEKPQFKEVEKAVFKHESPITSPSITNQSLSSASLIFYGALVVLGVGLLLGRLRKTTKPAPPPEYPALGKFLFDIKDQRLFLGNEVISLTGKECSVLQLLYKNFGELIPRERLMQEIWLNEGVITGRSLDMFVSKLRKKLSPDPELRITNVHGKGYKLEISATK